MVQGINWKPDSHSACKKIACFLYGTRRFITVFKKARDSTLSWASRIWFNPTIIISLRSILMLSPTYAWIFPVDSFPRDSQSNPSKQLSPHPCVKHPAHFILIDFIILTIFYTECRLRSSSICTYLHHPSSSLLGPNILKTLFSKTSVYFLPLTILVYQCRFQMFPSQVHMNQKGQVSYNFNSNF
jgi:hypothetical protein